MSLENGVSALGGLFNIRRALLSLFHVPKQLPERTLLFCNFKKMRKLDFFGTIFKIKNNPSFDFEAFWTPHFCKIWFYFWQLRVRENARTIFVSHSSSILKNRSWIVKNRDWICNLFIQFRRIILQNFNFLSKKAFFNLTCRATVTSVDCIKKTGAR